MRVFVPATMSDLETLYRTGSLSAEVGFALTDRFRAAAGVEVADDDEVLDYDLMMAAAQVSLDRQGEDQECRRVVLAVDLPARSAADNPASGRVLIDGPIERRDVASVHLDDAPLDPQDVRAGTVDGDLSWFAQQEIADIVGG